MTDDVIRSKLSEWTAAVADETLNGEAREIEETAESLEGKSENLVEEAGSGVEERNKEQSVDNSAHEGESLAKAFAQIATRPEMQAALSQLHYNKWPGLKLNLHELTSELDKQTEAVKEKKLGRGEAMLAAQAHTLDAIFNYLSRKASASKFLDQFEPYLKLALRAQGQCRMTWETISTIQNPPMAGYVKQAYIAGGHQQVNYASRTGESKNPPNKLLEDKDHEPDKLLDRRTPQATGQVDWVLETVEEVNGTKEPGR